MWLLILTHSSRFQGVFYPIAIKAGASLLLSPCLAASWDISVGLEELCTSDLPGAVPAPPEAVRAGSDLGPKGSLARPLELSF